MPNYTVRYTGSSPRLLSPLLWNDCPIAELLHYEADGFFHMDDFNNQGAISTTAATGKYASFADAACTITQMSTEKGGVLQLLTSATDNDDVTVTTGGNVGHMCAVSETAGNQYNLPLWFECRFKVQHIANTEKSIFLGLSAPALASASGIFSDADALSSQNYVGFLQSAAAGATIDAIWRAAGQATVTNLAAVNTMVADTYVKLGFHYNPNASASKRLTWYKNNVEQSTYGTNTQLTAATFPAAAALTLTAALKSAAANARVLQLDWWALAQLY